MVSPNDILRTDFMWNNRLMVKDYFCRSFEYTYPEASKLWWRCKKAKIILYNN